MYPSPAGASREAVIGVADASGVAAARRRAAALTREAGFGEAEAGRVAIVVTEAATNLLKHGNGGEILLQAFSSHSIALKRCAAFSLCVFAAIAGKGSVTVEGLSINCSASCAQAVASGSAVHLDATPASGMVFSGWSGACTGTGGCDLTLTQDAAVTATFAPAPPSMVTLAVQVVGSGSGRIVSSPR